MIRVASVIFGCLLGYAAVAQTLQSGSSSSITGGSTAFSGSVANCVLFNKNSVIGCDSGLTFAGGSNGNVTVGGGALFLGGNGTNRGVIIGLNGIADMAIGNDSQIKWSSSTNPSASYDVGISRSSTPGVIAIGNGSAVGNTVGGFITATATLTSLGTGTNADFLCLGGTGTILIQSTACTISSLRFKPDWKPYTDDALTRVKHLDVGTFHLQTGPNADPNAQSLQAGLSAESVAAIAPECAIYENDMKTPKSYRQECVIALLVKAIQQLNAR